MILEYRDVGFHALLIHICLDQAKTATQMHSYFLPRSTMDHLPPARSSYLELVIGEIEQRREQETNKIYFSDQSRDFSCS
jgi:hypothetical protein